MNILKPVVGVIAAVAIGTFAVSTASVAAEKTLNSVTSLQQTNVLAKAFLVKFVAVMNQAGKGVLQIKYVGGQEVVPPRKAAAALKRGQFDMLSSPTAYYIGTVPEGYGLLASNQGPRVLRNNGGWELLQKIYAEKAGAHLLSWGANMTSYHMYLAKKPPLSADGLPNLKGLKMRATGTYRPLFRALGATTINIKTSEVITAIQRGTVDGFGFTDVSLPAIGLHTVTKYRVQPNFYQTNTVETVNLASWKALSQAQKDMLNRMAIEYEVTSVQFIEAERLKEEVQIKAAGVKDIVLTGKAKAKYLEIAHGEIWKELKKRSKYHDQLKPLLYHPGKPNRQLKIKQQLDMKR
jgi:TRAP-type C4-dicarboxylate transport system substrate-binding protein